MLSETSLKALKFVEKQYTALGYHLTKKKVENGVNIVLTFEDTERKLFVKIEPEVSTITIESDGEVLGYQKSYTKDLASIYP